MKCAPTTAINEQLTSNVVKATEGRDVSHSQEAGGSPIIFYPTKRTAVTSRFEFILAEVGSSILLNESRPPATDEITTDIITKHTI